MTVRSYMQRLTPILPRRVVQRHQVFANLRNCPFVFIRVDKVHPPLQPSYYGPFRVLKSQDKYFVTYINGFNEKVGIDRPRLQNPSFIIKTRTNHTFHPGLHICDRSRNCYDYHEHTNLNPQENKIRSDSPPTTPFRRHNPLGVG